MEKSKSAGGVFFRDRFKNTLRTPTSCFKIKQNSTESNSTHTHIGGGKQRKKSRCRQCICNVPNYLRLKINCKDKEREKGYMEWIISVPGHDKKVKRRYCKSGMHAKSMQFWLKPDFLCRFCGTKSVDNAMNLD